MHECDADVLTFCATSDHLARCQDFSSLLPLKPTIVKAYTPADAGSELRTLLLKRRGEETAKKFGHTLFVKYGGHLLLQEITLQRIIDCAQAGRLETRDRLQKEISWESNWLDKFGESLLEVVHTIFPLHDLP
ncbi:hypothetical protein OBBRIDRAFT_247931 [Obba rivulosa]|uniref:Uncharacterized protein n=1 Tax=Obba rivulosa TaxID=1052685 RepID=A0A8E2AQV5_9APHY|nr:hypothetical protein OBBRIDRAFT_247931 [Obba rivulosa]